MGKLISVVIARLLLAKNAFSNVREIPLLWFVASPCFPYWPAGSFIYSKVKVMVDSLISLSCMIGCVTIASSKDPAA